MQTHTFFSNSDRDFYSENNNVSQVYTYLHNKNTIKKKVKKRYYRQCAPFYMLLFVICFSS
jgi:hypothetical protein